MKELKKILVPVDGSAESVCACQWAVSIAEKTQAELRLLYVVDLNEKMNSFDQVSMSGYIPETIKKKGEELLYHYACHIPHGVRYETVLKLGSPYQQILAFAEEWKPDWILMGSRGASNLREIIMGSVSQYVLHHVSCPVMIVREEGNFVGS